MLLKHHFSGLLSTKERLYNGHAAVLEFKKLRRYGFFSRFFTKKSLSWKDNFIGFLDLEAYLGLVASSKTRKNRNKIVVPVFVGKCQEQFFSEDVSQGDYIVVFYNMSAGLFKRLKTIEDCIEFLESCKKYQSIGELMVDHKMDICPIFD